MVSVVLVMYVILFRQSQIMQLRQDVLHSQVMWGFGFFFFFFFFFCFFNMQQHSLNVNRNSI